MPTNIQEPSAEEREIAFLRKNQARFLANPNGLTVYQLGLLLKLTGSKKIAALYREMMSAIGPYARNADGIVE